MEKSTEDRNVSTDQLVEELESRLEALSMMVGHIQLDIGTIGDGCDEVSEVLEKLKKRLGT